MNCFQARRDMMARPHEHDAERAAHVHACPDCSRAAAQLGGLDREIERAALVPVPEGLNHRILMVRRSPPKWRYAVAAAFAAVAVVVAVPVLVPGVMDTFELNAPAEAVGPAHPGVAAISLIADEEESALHPEKVGDPAEIEHSLKRLGLKLGKGDAPAYYVGKCQVGGGECDHILLSTPDGYANVLLLPDYQVAERVLVTDRRMTALVNSAPNGGYIVVGQSPKFVKRTERMFRRG